MAAPSWLTYSNDGATRSQPISPDLVRAMSFLPELGVTMNVYSGGQPASGGNRVGSTRHDHGNAADVMFYQDGRMLNWNNERDLAVLSDIVSRARSSGVTGIGAGDDYMGPGRVHIGFGPEAVWGAGGMSANAPEWLRSAFNAPASARPPALQAIDAALPMNAQPRPQGVGLAPSPPGGISGILANALGIPASGISGMLSPQQSAPPRGPQFFEGNIAYGAPAQATDGRRGMLSSTPGRMEFDERVHGRDMSIMRANREAIREATGLSRINQDSIDKALAAGATLYRPT